MHLDRLAAEAVDQQALITALQRIPHVGFHRDAEVDGAGSHHSRQAAAAQGRRDPSALAVHQQVADCSAAQFALGVVQQGVIGSSAFGFAASLDRSGVGEGFASTTHAVAIAAFEPTCDRSDWLETHAARGEREPKAMLVGVGYANASFPPGAAAPVQAQGPTRLVQFAFHNRFIDEAAEIPL